MCICMCTHMHVCTNSRLPMPIYTHAEARGRPQVFKNVCPCDPWELNPNCRSLRPIQATWQTQAKRSTPLSQGYLFPPLCKSSEGCGYTGITVRPTQARVAWSSFPSGAVLPVVALDKCLSPFLAWLSWVIV